MKRHLLLMFLTLATSALGQVVTISPTLPTIDDEITLTFDVKLAPGNNVQGLLGLTDDVYLWSGAGDETGAFIYEPPGQTNFGVPFVPGEMTALGDDVWEITLTPRSYYQIPEGTRITRLGLLLKNGDGSAQTEDLFVDIDPGKFLTLLSPPYTDRINLVDQGQVVPIKAQASEDANLQMVVFAIKSDGDGLVSTTNTDTIQFDFTVTENEEVKITTSAFFNSGGVIDRIDTVEFFIKQPNVVEALPAGLQLGINYDDINATKATLVLLAPQKERVYIVGNFTNWELKDEFQMKVDPDGETFWLEVTGLTPGQEYIFQYWVDGVIKVIDPYADKVANPFSDPFIPESVYPGLIEYPDPDGNGVASILQTAQTPFVWDASEDTWQRPAKEDLVVYELFMGDFLDSHYYQDMIDTLGYFKRLGINAIELMPPAEHEGDAGWGYDPYAMLAPEKFYGTKNDLKEFIQACHQNGIAVIQDIVLNHQTGLNAYNLMYFNPDTSRPSADSPFFNENAAHPSNVFEDMNHESPYVQNYVDSVVQYWIQEYHFDGYRFDLSKGFTQTNNPGNVAAWGQFDQSRIDILTRIANKIWDIDPEAYVMLEHFADADEENELASRGMLLWGNFNFRFRDLLSGVNVNTDLGGLDNPAYVNYMESHDEERLVYATNENGRNEGDYNVRDLETGLNRSKLGAAFFFTVPGPKMMWQFQEFGYDQFLPPDGPERTNPKPTIWNSENGNLNYYNDPLRQKLFETYAAIIHLTHDFEEVFDSETTSFDFSGSRKSLVFQHPTMDVVIIGNFGLSSVGLVQAFPETGTWYDYLTGDSTHVKRRSDSYLLQPGEFHIFTSQKLETPGEDLVPFSAVWDPFFVNLTLDKTTVNEGENVMVTVTNEIPVEGDQIVNITVSSPAEVQLQDSQVTIADGETEGTTEIVVIDDEDEEEDEEIIVSITAGSDGVIVGEDSVTFTINASDMVTGLEPGQNADLKLFPNPAQQYVVIESKEHIFQEISLYSMFGAKVEEIKLENGEPSIKLDLSSYAPGIYFLELRSRETSFIRKLYLEP